MALGTSGFPADNGPELRTLVFSCSRKAVAGLARRVFVGSAASAFLIPLIPVIATADSGQGIDVRVTASGPWMAQLVNFDLKTVHSVTYYVRDASNHWRQTHPVNSAPFETPVNWWEGDNSGYEVVTAHVNLVTDTVLRDPGGWHWVDGHHADPNGSIRAWTNMDGTPGATYTPDFHLDDIKAVEFWFRDAKDQWHDVGPGSRSPKDAAWLVQSFKGIPTDWQGVADAVSVHVVWPGGQQLADPTHWAEDFTAQPIAVATPAAPAPVSVAPAPPAAVAPPPPAADPYASLRTQGVSAICNDGTYSHSKTRSGTCSHHGGVSVWTGLI
jgi:hypothetical protein